MKATLSSGTLQAVLRAGMAAAKREDSLIPISGWLIIHSLTPSLLNRVHFTLIS